MAPHLQLIFSTGSLSEVDLTISQDELQHLPTGHQVGPNWSPSLPREPPGWSQTLFLMIFDGFWIDFWLLFAFAHLSAITFFAVVFGFLFG